MTTRRLVPAFAVAFALAALLTWVVDRRLTRPVLAATPVRLDHLVAAGRPLNVGDTLTAEALTAVDWPAGSVPAGSVRRPQELAGRVLQVPVAAGEPVLAQYLAAPGTGAGLLARIPDGMRAVAVHADEIAGVAGFVAPDSFVDVLLTTHTNGDASAATACILQDVRVLAVGQRTEADGGGKPSTATAGGDTMTLLLSADDAEKLAQATAVGKILFLLRNGADRGTVAVNTAPLAMRAANMAPAGAGSRAAVAAKNQASAPAAHVGGFVVETVAGGKQSSESFEGKN